MAVSREVREETGLQLDELFSLNETFIFYDEASNSIQLTPVFVALVSTGSLVVIDPEEHSSFDWVGLECAPAKLYWPAQRRALEQLIALLEEGPLPSLMKMKTSFKIDAN